MCNAILSTSNRDNPICAICRDGFEGQQEKWTHEGGEGHDPFHKDCLRALLVRKSRPCPYSDGALIRRNSVFSRTERIFETVKQSLAVIACSLVFGFLIAAVEEKGDPLIASITAGLGLGVEALAHRAGILSGAGAVGTGILAALVAAQHNLAWATSTGTEVAAVVAIFIFQRFGFTLNQKLGVAYGVIVTGIMFAARIEK